MNDLCRRALTAARNCILIDRTALADSAMDPVTNRIDDPDTMAGLAEYDNTLAMIDTALCAGEDDA